MIEIARNNCTGCRVCEITCPTNSISMVFDDMGFLYPYVDIRRCVKCGKCLKNCHALEDNKASISTYNKDIHGYYGWSKDNQMILNSSSGGGIPL